MSPFQPRIFSLISSNRSRRLACSCIVFCYIFHLNILEMDFFSGHNLTSMGRHSLVGSIQDLRTGGRWFDLRARAISFPRIHDSHCDRTHSSLTTVHCFDNVDVGKQPVACKEYCSEYW